MPGPSLGEKVQQFVGADESDTDAADVLYDAEESGRRGVLGVPQPDHEGFHRIRSHSQVDATGASDTTCPPPENGSS